LRYLIEHETALAFPRPVREHQCELRLAPRDGADQRRIACRIEVEPGAPIRSHVDSFGNLVHRFSLLAPHEALRVRVEAAVETALANPFDYEPVPVAAERSWLEQRLRVEPTLYSYVLHRSDSVPELRAQLGGLAIPVRDASRSLLENVQAVMRWAEAEFSYEPGATEVHGALAEFAVQRAGVCQDFAHLVVAIVRSWGFAARYAMGYVEPETVGEAASAVESTHAWAEVLVPGAGWRGFDATCGLVACDTYVAVAAGRDSRDAAPVRGTFKGDAGNEAPQVQVRVAREAEVQQAQ
jgi:transglutaminase-like putative cysteine protease